MAVEALIDPLLQVLRVLFLPLVGIFILNEKTAEKRVEALIILVVLFLLGTLATGGHYDLFDNTPWTVQFTLIISMIYFLIIQFPSSIDTRVLWGIIILYFVFLSENIFWSNLLSGTLYFIFWAGFAISMVKVVKGWITTPAA